MEVRQGKQQDAKKRTDLQELDFARVQSIAVARIARQDEPKRVSDDFPGRGLASKWRELNATECTGFPDELRQPLAAALKAYADKLSDGEERVTLSGFCIPDPGYAVRLKTDKGMRYLAICLECGFMEMQDERGHRQEFWFTGNKELQARLGERYRDQFDPANRF